MVICTFCNKEIVNNTIITDLNNQIYCESCMKARTGNKDDFPEFEIAFDPFQNQNI